MTTEQVPDWLRAQIKKDNLMKLAKELMVEEAAINTIKLRLFRMRNHGQEKNIKYKIYEEKLKPHEERLEKIKKESELYSSL